MLELAKQSLKKLSPVVIVHHYLILFPRRGPGFDPRPGKTNFEAHIPSTPRFQVAKMRHPPQKEAMMDGARRMPSTRDDKKVFVLLTSRNRMSTLFVEFSACLEIV